MTTTEQQILQLLETLNWKLDRLDEKVNSVEEYRSQEENLNPYSVFKDCEILYDYMGLTVGFDTGYFCYAITLNSETLTGQHRTLRRLIEDLKDEFSIGGEMLETLESIRNQYISQAKLV